MLACHKPAHFTWTNIIETETIENVQFVFNKFVQQFVVEIIGQKFCGQHLIALTLAYKHVSAICTSGDDHKSTLLIQSLDAEVSVPWMPKVRVI